MLHACTHLHYPSTGVHGCRHAEMHTDEHADEQIHAHARTNKDANYPGMLSFIITSDEQVNKKDACICRPR
eukprot:m.38771 g.38771  ORF g.38771 m.38771 type:complete len:71 (+) comp11521_c0_seq2:330-542(+)